MKILNLKPYLQEKLCEAFSHILFASAVENHEDADAVIGESRDFTNEFLEKFPRIKWLQTCRAGYDEVDLPYLNKRGIMLTNARDLYSIPIAEDVVCKILMGSTGALFYLDNQKVHEWKTNRERKELRGKTVGILGTGSIGTEVAKRLQGFEVNIIGYKKTPVISLPYFHKVYTGKKGLTHVISQSDYLVVTMDLNDETRGLLNEEIIGLMKDRAGIINVSRGALIDRNALIKAIKQGKIGYAGLDVFVPEPLPQDDVFWDMPQVYITPHASGIVCENRDRLFNLICENITRYEDGEILLNRVYR